ncbi:hypothetical protein VTO58DRAFT_108360 [Aureobasidium pullulans]
MPQLAPGLSLGAAHSLLANQITPLSIIQPRCDGASGSHASTFGDFHTPSQGSAVKFLNAGSAAEGSSTKRSSLSPVKPVGSGFSSPSRVSAPLLQGPVFSTGTDTDPNTSETRFVCFDLILEQWTQDSGEGCVLNKALEYTGLIGLIDTAVGSPSEVLGFTLFETVLTTVAFSFISNHECFGVDHKTLFETVLTTVACSFISHHEYFGADHTKVCTMSHLPTKMERQDSGNPADNRKTLQSAGSSAWLMYTSRLMKQDLSTGLIGLLDLMASPSNESQPLTPSVEHNLWTFGSAMNAADFGECFDYDMFIRCLGSLRASASGTRRGMFLLIVRYCYNFKLTLSSVASSLTPTKKFRAVFLFGSVARNAVPVGRVVENGSSEYLDFRSTEFTALSLFEDVISNVILDVETASRRE